MKAIQLTIYKIRKAIYLILESIQAVLLPPAMRTGKFFDDTPTRWTSQSFQESPAYQELLETVNSKGLFIVGAGRSGTTILRRVLNSSPQICLWHEANIYLNLNNPMFAENFNRQHENKDQEKKATFISEPITPEINALQTVARVGKPYMLSGEKLVFLANNNPQAFFEFHTKYFLNSQYFFVIRHPAEVVWSMTKMFPEESIDKFILIWLQSAEIILRSMGTFEQAHLIFLQNVSGDLVETFEQILSLDLPFPREKLAPRSQKSSLNEKKLPAKLTSYRAAIETCTRIYMNLLENFSPETLSYSGEKDEWVFLRSKRIQLNDCIGALEHFRADTLEAKAALMAAINNNFAISLAGLTDKEISTIGAYPNYKRAKVEQNLYTALGEEFDQLRNSNSNPLRIWCLGLLVERLRRVSRDEAADLISKKLGRLTTGTGYQENTRNASE